MIQKTSLKAQILENIFFPENQKLHEQYGQKSLFSFFSIGYWDPYSVHWSKMQLHVTVERLRQLWLTLAVFIQHYASFHLAAYRIANQHEHTVNPISGVPDISIYYINRNVSPLQGQKFFAVHFTVPCNQPQFQLRNKLGNRIIL